MKHPLPRGSAAVLALCWVALSCTPLDRRFDALPISVDNSTGGIFLFATTAEDGEPLPLAIDTLSPITVVDDEGVSADIRRQRVTLTLYGASGGQADVPRAEFIDTSAYNLHPCGEASQCFIGSDALSTEIRGYVGFDVLGRGAMTFDFPASAVQITPDIAGSTPDRRRACETVFASPFAGGGTLLINGDEVVFGADRPAIRTCLAPDEDEAAGVSTGTDALLVVSTAVGPSLMSESAYERYRLASGAPELSALAEFNVFLPGGAIAGREATIPRSALLGDTSLDRGACTELFANRLMRNGGCPNSGRSCPCRANSDTFCRAGGSIVLSSELRFVVIPDETAFLQALRDELRPELPDVDGILGTEALAPLRVAFDYPNGRIIMKCLETENCETRQTVVSRRSLSAIEECAALEEATRNPPADE